MKKTSLPAWSSRFSAFLILWLVLDGVKPAGLFIGLLPAALAAWIGVRLLPPSRSRPRLMALLLAAMAFLWELGRGWGWRSPSALFIRACLFAQLHDPADPQFPQAAQARSFSVGMGGVSASHAAVAEGIGEYVHCLDTSSRWPSRRPSTRPDW